MRSTAAVVLEEKRDASKLFLLLRMPEDLLYFQGHFDGQPVLPGVVQLHWAVEFGIRRLGCGRDFRGCKSLKFHHVIVPAQDVALSLEHRSDKQELHFSYTSVHGIHSRGCVILT